MGQDIGAGGFFFPTVYRESKPKVVELVQQGKVDLVESARFTFADKFMAFILQSEFLKFADRTYPNPREKTEIPVWFLISCQFVLKINHELAYSTLGTLLKSGPVLSRIGFNVASPLGFNDKNQQPRQTPVHHDSVRKFFKDTDPKAMREWFCQDLQKWFRGMQCFDSSGVFILDQTHLVVPDNEHYLDAVRMPVDEHGQLYKDLERLTAEQKKALRYHPCYTLSTLLHLSYEQQAFHITGYEFGPGNEDELPQAKRLLLSFFKHNKPGSMKLLIADRGYIDGEFITWLKQEYKVDTLIPLKSNMTQCQDAIAISEMPETQWVMLSQSQDTEDFALTRACFIEDVQLWDKCKVPLFMTVVEKKHTDRENGGIVYSKFCLCSTKKFDSPHQVISSYRLRGNTEECFRQFKNFWDISKFPSPYGSLLEAHVAFTLLTFSLLQLYLLRQDLQDSTSKTLKTLQREELNNHNNILVYAAHFFAAFSVKEYTLLINSLPQEARQKLISSFDSALHQL